jgi:hypothetical protein
MNAKSHATTKLVQHNVGLPGAPLAASKKKDSIMLAHQGWYLVLQPQQTGQTAS